MYVLQLCHDYKAPFLSVANQYASLFKGSPFKLVTVYLKGKPSAEVEAGSASDEVIFLDYSAKDIRGLKLRQIRDLRKLQQKYQFKFAVAHRYKALYICAHVPGLFTVGIHHAFGDYERWSRSWFVQRHRQQLALLGVSNAVRDDMRRCLPKLTQIQVQTLYNRIDLSGMRQQMVEREAARNKLGLAADKYYFANVGRLHPDKDQSTLLRGFARVAEKLSNSELLILGAGRDEAKLKQLTSELGITRRVQFLGVVPDAWRYFKAFNSFVLSSDHEPFGMVLLEAMAAGLPIASTNCGGAPEVVGDTGLLFPLGNVEALARCMEQLYALPADELGPLQQKMDKQVVQHFSEDAVREAFWQLPFIKSLQEQTAL